MQSYMSHPPGSVAPNPRAAAMSRPLRSPRRVRVSETDDYVKYRLVEDGAAVASHSRDEMIRRKIEMHPPLLGWVVRARLLGAAP